MKEKKNSTPLNLKLRALKDNKQSYYIRYKNQKLYLKLILVNEQNQRDKLINKETTKKANTILNEKIREYNECFYTGKEFVLKLESNNIYLFDYMQTLKDQKETQKTKDNYDSLTNHLKEYSKDVLIKKIDVNYINGFIDYLKNSKLKKNSQKLYISVFKIVLNSAFKDGLIKNNPFDKVKLTIKKETTQRQYLTDNEVEALDQTDCKNTEVKNAFLFSCFTGLRLSDVEDLKWNDIKKEGTNTFICIRMQKTKELLKIPLIEKAQKHLPKTKEQEHIFNLPTPPAIKNHLKKWTNTAGINKNISFHCARHTFATLLLSKGVNISYVQKLMGHTNVNTTQIYAKVTGINLVQSMDVLNK